MVSVASAKKHGGQDATLFEENNGERSSIWLEHKIVDLGVAGSIPVAHPFLSSIKIITYDKKSN